MTTQYSNKLAKQLHEHVKSKPYYDEVGKESWAFGWHAIVEYRKVLYIVSYQDNVFTYRPFLTRQAVRKAWDHLCEKFESWFITENE